MTLEVFWKSFLKRIVIGILLEEQLTFLISAGTQENSTLVQFMKDFDNSLVTWSNSSTVLLNTDSIPIRFDGGLFGDEIQENNDTRYVLTLHIYE